MIVDLYRFNGDILSTVLYYSHLKRELPQDGQMTTYQHQAPIPWLNSNVICILYYLILTLRNFALRVFCIILK